MSGSTSGGSVVSVFEFQGFVPAFGKDKIEAAAAIQGRFFLENINCDKCDSNFWR